MPVLSIKTWSEDLEIQPSEVTPTAVKVTLPEKLFAQVIVLEFEESAIVPAIDGDITQPYLVMMLSKVEQLTLVVNVSTVICLIESGWEITGPVILPCELFKVITDGVWISKPAASITDTLYVPANKVVSLLDEGFNGFVDW